MERTFIDIEAAPDELLRQLGKDGRLVPYGGANFGMPLDLIEPAWGRLVPNDRFFVRSNGPVPVVDLRTWRLEVTGTVERPCSLSLDDLQRLGSSRIEAFLECAGNGRTRFEPRPPGTPWRNDAVGNAVWEGVPLARALELAGVTPGTVDVVTQGADFPEMRRGLPLIVARDPGVMLVWGMNGEPLPVANGFPVRMLIPGLYGYVSACKWLVRIEATTFDAVDAYWTERDWAAEGPIKIASRIDTPPPLRPFPAGRRAIAGVAWAQTRGIAKVEVRVDDEDWVEAELSPEVDADLWRQWVLPYDFAPGRHSVTVRATGADGEVQTDERADPFPAGSTGWHSVEVQVG